MKKEELPFLTQMIESLNDIISKLEEASNMRDMRKQKELSSLILNIQQKISDILK